MKQSARKSRRKSRADRIIGERVNPFRAQHAEDVVRDAFSEEDEDRQHVNCDRIVDRRDPLKFYSRAPKKITRRMRDAGMELRRRFQEKREAKMVGGYTDMISKGSIADAFVARADWETEMVRTMRQLPSGSVIPIQWVCFDERHVMPSDIPAMKAGLTKLADIYGFG